VIAETEFDLARIGCAVVLLINPRIAPVLASAQSCDAARDQDPEINASAEGSELDGAFRLESMGNAMVELSSELWRLSRYERRARSRRNRAMIELLKSKPGTPTAGPQVLGHRGRHRTKGPKHTKFSGEADAREKLG
jgi:hypothetical protein